MVRSKTVIPQPYSVFFDSIQVYEHTFKQGEEEIKNLEAADDKTKYEMYYAKDFLEVFNRFSSTAITFEDLQVELKNKIDKRVREKMAGRVSLNAPSKPPVPQPIPGPMPVAKPGNPFGALLNQPPGKLDDSNGSHSDQSGPRLPLPAAVTVPRFGGPSPATGHNKPPAQPSQQQPTKNDSEVHLLKQMVSSLEEELGLAKSELSNAERQKSTLQTTIDNLRRENERLGRQMEAEKARADQANRNSAQSGQGEATRMLRERIKDLETEIELMNSQNAKLLEALKEANKPQMNSQSQMGISLGPTKHEEEFHQRIQHLTKKLEMAEAENRILRENSQKGNDSFKGNLGNSDLLTEKLIRLESENQVLRKGNMQ